MARHLGMDLKTNDDFPITRVGRDPVFFIRNAGDYEHFVVSLVQNGRAVLAGT